MPTTVFFHTLGCKLNYSETVTFGRQFQMRGVVEAAAATIADILVVNSCAVTEQAQKKCRQYFRKVRRQNPKVFIVLVGCYANLSPNELRAQEKVNLVVTGKDKGRLAQLTLEALGQLPKSSCERDNVEQSFFHAYSDSGRTRAFLKVQDGCDYRCTYCTIPLARGRSHSPTIAEIVREAETIAAKGVKEIVLAGVNTGDFGRTHGEQFLDLLKALECVEGIARYRISSIEPNLLRDEVLDFMASSSRFLPHLHVPLQSGSDYILKRMGRRYTTEIFRDRIQAARHYLGDPFIGIDVIVAFPGETDSHFEETHSFLAEVIRPAYLHVFPYSIRPGTPAATMPGQVKEDVAHHRVNRLISLSDSLHADYALSYAHTVRPVLLEGISKRGRAFGYTDNYIKVEFPVRNARKGAIVPLRLGTTFTDGVMRGDLENAMVAE